MSNVSTKSMSYRKVQLSDEDRSIIKERLRRIAEEKGLDILLIVNPDNFTYATGIVAPFPQLLGTPQAACIIKDIGYTVICPFEWQQLSQEQEHIKKIVAYNHYGNEIENNELVSQIGKVLKNLPDKKIKIGIDLEQIPINLFNRLENLLNGVEWFDINEALKKSRAIKTEGEIAVLEEAARVNNRALIAALNHSEGSVSDSLSYHIWELAERVRVHIGEFGGSGCGNLSVLQGDDLRFYFGNSEGKVIRGNPLRIESTAHNYGYWSDNTQTIFAGDPPKEFLEAYEKNIQLKNFAKSLLTDGKKVSDIFISIRDMAIKNNIAFIEEYGAGHSIGVSEREAPYLCINDDTLIKKNMVIVLAIYTYGPGQTIICSKDTFAVTDADPVLLSWYKSFDQLYSLIGTAARHG